MAIEGVVAAAAAAAAVTVTVAVAVAAAATAAAAAVPLSDRYIDGGGGGREDMSHVHTRPAEPQTPDDNDASNRIESGQQLQVQVQVQVQGRVQAQTQAQVPVAMWDLMEDRDRALEEDDVKERRRRRYYYCQVDCDGDGYRDALRFERTRTTEGEVWWEGAKDNNEGG